MDKIRVLMIGPGRDVKGGISAVINNYYTCGLDRIVDLHFIPTMQDGTFARKLVVALVAYIHFFCVISNYDIVHVHMAAQASFDRKALFIRQAKRAGKTIIIHQHSADFNDYYKNVNEKKRIRIRKTFNLADRIIVLSDQWASFFEKICDREKIRVLQNGVIMPDYEKRDYSNHNVLVLGRLGERKGTYDLLEIIPRIIREINDIAFYLCGDGDIDNCNRLVKKRGMGNNVIIRGWISGREREELLKKCSIFVLPSHHEGMPMALLEAMSYGLAAISTNVGGIPQVIEQGVSGIIVDAGNTEHLFLELLGLIKDERKKKELGCSGSRKIRENYDCYDTIKRLTEIYYELI